MSTVMLDSGAFSAWSREEEITLDSYLDFCVSLPKISYYVNLDVIPPKLGRTEKSRSEAVEDCCRKSWKNYRKMIKHLPKEKVIPVYHQQDGMQWLERYLDFEVPYLGISPDKEISFKLRLAWVQKLRKILLRDGKPIVKLHGFGTATFDSVRSFPWTSVDSSSPILAGGLGRLFVPRERRGGWEYTEPPMMLNCTDRMSHRRDGGLLNLEEEGIERISLGHSKSSVVHLLSLSPREREVVDRYLTERRVKVGRSESVPVGAGYVLKEGERWENDKQKKVLRVVEKGVLTCHRRRKHLNILYFQELGRAYGVNVYISGVGGISKRTEGFIDYRLLSFYEIQQLVDSRMALVSHGIAEKDEINRLWKSTPRPQRFKGGKAKEKWTTEERMELLDRMLGGEEKRKAARIMDRSASSLGAELSCLQRNKAGRLEKFPERGTKRRGRAWNRFETQFVWGYFRWAGKRGEKRELGVGLVANALCRTEEEIRSMIAKGK